MNNTIYFYNPKKGLVEKSTKQEDIKGNICGLCHIGNMRYAFYIASEDMVYNIIYILREIYFRYHFVDYRLSLKIK